MKKVLVSKLHPGQAEVYRVITSPNPPKFNVLACGARWGKDRLCISILLHLATRLAYLEKARRIRECLIPRVLCWYVAPSYGLLRQAWDEMKIFARSIPGVKFNNSELRVFFPGDVQIEFKSADNPGSLLARGLDVVVCTEAARMKREAWENAIMTRLSSPGRGTGGKGGIAILNSTPNGKNWFYELYKSALADTTGYYRAWHFTSYDNPGVNSDIIDAQRLRVPDRVYRQEYLAEFIESGGSVFRRVLDSLVEYKFPYQTLGTTFIGIDWGRYNDRTIAVAIEPINGKYRLADFLFLDKVPYEGQIKAIARFCKNFPSCRVIAEANSLGDPLIAQLRSAIGRKVTPFTTTHTMKKLVVENASTLMEQGLIELPGKLEHGYLNSQVKILTDELSEFEVKISSAGVASYGAPIGQHDDSVMAFCIALNGGFTRSINGRLEMV